MPARNRAIGGHHSAAAHTTEWLTPPAIIAGLGGSDSFDLDPCAPELRPWSTARAHYTVADDGLARPWHGRVWLNPPYSSAEVVHWLARLGDHGQGTALIFARTETESFVRHVWQRATAVLFIAGRLHFHHLDGYRAAANSGAPSVLIAYGLDDTDILAATAAEVGYDARGSVIWPERRIPGQFVPLRIPRSVLGAIISAPTNADEEIIVTWRALVAGFLGERDGPVAVADLYRAFAAHPKAQANPHYREKLRQTLQRGEGEAFQRAGRGLWERAP